MHDELQQAVLVRFSDRGYGLMFRDEAPRDTVAAYLHDEHNIPLMVRRPDGQRVLADSWTSEAKLDTAPGKSERWHGIAIEPCHLDATREVLLQHSGFSEAQCVDARTMDDGAKAREFANAIQTGRSLGL